MALNYTPVNENDSDNKSYLVEVRKEVSDNLVNSKEIDALTSTISIDDSKSIVMFGNKAAEQISKCSDEILNGMNLSQINESGELLNSLTKIMAEFDIDEIKGNQKKGLLNRFFGSIQKQVEKILDKYNSMGAEVDKIYIKLKEYEEEIGASNEKLDMMFKANVNYYKELVKYIVAGEQGVKEIENYIEEVKSNFEKTGDNSYQFELTNLEQAKSMLEQRVMDLRIAENIALQSIPMIKTMEFSNLNLVRKINSAFIITLPVFKQALSQSILLKRQRIQADAMKALDDKTNEMLIKNAQNSVLQAKMTAELSSGSSIKIETLEKTWNTIMTGIEETKKIQENASKKREEDTKKLERLKEEFKVY